MDFLDYECDSDLTIIIPVTVGAAAIILAVTAVIIAIIIVKYCKKMKEKQLQSKKELQTQVSNDKTMEKFTKMLDTMYSQVDKVPEDMVDLFTDKINRYSAVIDDIAKTNTCAFKDVHAKEENDGGVGMYTTLAIISMFLLGVLIIACISSIYTYRKISLFR